MKEIREMANAAANWWGERVRTDTNHDNGDTSFNGFLATFMANSLNEVVTEEQSGRFCELLADKIVKTIEEEGRFSSWYLDCDYGSSTFLMNVAKEVGISSHNFPWKTHMRIDEEDGVFVCRASGGYCMPWDQIWPRANVATSEG